VKAQKRPTTDARQQREAQCIVSAITRQLPTNWQGGWETVVFQDPEPNAFALPGGKVGVYTGIFKVATTQDQLAGVISHEIGHVISRHHEERITRQMGAQGAVQVLGALLGSRYGEGSAARRCKAQRARTDGLPAAGSREQETEADVVGQQLMAQAGFDPRGAVALWTNMIAASNGSRPPQWLSTHPNPESRIRELQQRAASLVPVYEQARAAGRRPSCG
jgi:predicted Zn-dependent protease